jgi:hypothetical protein
LRGGRDCTRLDRGESIGERKKDFVDERLGVRNIWDDEFPELLEDRLLGLGLPKDHACVCEQVAKRISSKLLLGVFPFVVEPLQFFGWNATDDLGLQDV